MKQTEEFNEILDLTSNIFNIDRNELISKDRSMHLAIPRNAAAVIGVKKAMLKKEIVAKGLNRHRTLIYHYLKNHKQFFKYHKPYAKGYLKILNAYKNIDVSRKQFIDKDEFKLFVEKINFKNAKKPDIIISVSCAKYNHNFLSSCFKFSDDIEIIKDAFKEYKCVYDYNTYER